MNRLEDCEYRLLKLACSADNVIVAEFLLDELRGKLRLIDHTISLSTTNYEIVLLVVKNGGKLISSETMRGPIPGTVQFMDIIQYKLSIG